MTADKLATFLNAAWDWSERNDIPLEVWRTEQGDWYVTLRMKDSKGWYSQSLAYFSPRGRNNGKNGETEESYIDRVHDALGKASQQAREQRIKTFNKLAKLLARAV